MSTYYIITKSPATFVNYKWSYKDSVDGVKYDTFEKAADSYLKNKRGFGVSLVIEEAN